MSSKQAFVNVVEVMGGDIAVINAASRLSKTHGEITERDKTVLRQIVRYGRGRPFEQAIFSFYIKVPMFVAMEWIAEQIGSFNIVETSEPEFYNPREWRMREQQPAEGKTAKAKKDAEAARDEDKKINNDNARTAAENVNNYAGMMYKFAIEAGVTEEHARLLLPASTYVEFRWVVNARDLMRFISMHVPNGRVVRELRLYAAFVEKMFKDAMPASYEAFVAAEKKAP